jgi:hypothetical protein
MHDIGQHGGGKIRACVERDVPRFDPMLMQAMNLIVDASTAVPMISTKVSVTL